MMKVLVYEQKFDHLRSATAMEGILSKEGLLVERKGKLVLAYATTIAQEYQWRDRP